MSKFKQAILTFVLFLPFLVQAQVDVQLRQPPPYQLKLEDFWKVTLLNTSSSNYNVYLYGVATSSGVGKVVDAKSKTFIISPGMKVVSRNDVTPIKVLEKNRRYEDAIMFTGELPTGDYEICVTVYNADNGEVLGSECISHAVEIIQGIELLIPEDKSKIIAGGQKSMTEDSLPKGLHPFPSLKIMQENLDKSKITSGGQKSMTEDSLPKGLHPFPSLKIMQANLDTSIVAFKNKKDADWDEAFAGGKKTDKDWDEATATFKKKTDEQMDAVILQPRAAAVKDLDFNEVGNELRRQQDGGGDSRKRAAEQKIKLMKEYNSAVKKLKKAVDTKFDQSLAEFKKKKDSNYDETTTQLKKKIDSDYNHALAKFKKEVDKDYEESSTRFVPNENPTETNVAGSFITFSWLAPSPAPRNGKVTYKLTITEILFNQTAYSSIQSNPAFYKIDNLPSTVHLFPFVSRGFVSGRKYAWQVTAYLNGVKMTQSEVNEFIYINNNIPVLKKKDKVGPILIPQDIKGYIPEWNNEIHTAENENKKVNAEIAEDSQSGAEENKTFGSQPTVIASEVKKSQWDYFGRPSLAMTEPYKEKHPLLYADISNAIPIRLYPYTFIPLLGDSLPGKLKKRKSPFKFSGNVKLYGETSNRQGTHSEIPATFGNVELAPSLSIYDIPLSYSMLLTTLGNNSKQSINNFTFGLNASTLSELIQQKKDKALEKAKDYIDERVKEKGELFNEKLEIETKQKIEERVKEKGEEFRQQIETEENEKAEQKIILNEAIYRDKIEKGIDANSYKSLSAGLKFFSYFKTLAVGVTYPEYTKHTLSGVAVNGANVEFNPGILYMAFTASNNTKAIDNLSYKRDLIAGRLGIGKIDKTNFILTAMHAKDRENPTQIDSLNQTLTPKENWVVGVDQRFSFFKTKLKIESEGVMSILTRDTRDPDIGIEDLPEGLTNFIKPKGSNSADYMYAVKGTFDNDKSNTRIGAEMKMIGPGFITLGNPALRNDRLSYEAKIDQKFLKRKITTGINFKTIKDNLINTKTATTTSTSMMFNLGLNFKKFPTLRISVMPSSQKNNKEITAADSSGLDNQTLLYNVTSSYPYKIGKVRAQTMVLYSYNATKTLFGLYDYWSRTSQITESITFQKPLAITAGIGLIETGGESYSRAITIDVSPSYTIKEKILLVGGVNITSDKGNSDRVGYNFNSTFLLGKYFTFEMRYEYARFNEVKNSKNNYLEHVLRGTLNVRW